MLAGAKKDFRNYLFSWACVHHTILKPATYQSILLFGVELWNDFKAGSWQRRCKMFFALQIVKNICTDCKIHLYKLQNVVVQIIRYICPSFKIHFYEWQNAFDQIYLSEAKVRCRVKVLPGKYMAGAP